MKIPLFFLIALITLSVSLSAASTPSADEFVAVSNNNYQLGKGLVTVDQYAAFLNAVASKEDPHHLYKPEMEYSIVHDEERSRNGDAYAIFPDQADRPITFITLHDAMRYINWVEHGEPTFEEAEQFFQQTGQKVSETGAYNFSMESGVEVASANSNATYYLPTLDEIEAGWTQAIISRTDDNEWTTTLVASHDHAETTLESVVARNSIEGETEIMSVDALEMNATLGFRIGSREKMAAAPPAMQCSTSSPSSTAPTKRKNEESALWSTTMTAAPTATGLALAALEYTGVTIAIAPAGVVIALVMLRYYGADHGWWY